MKLEEVLSQQNMKRAYGQVVGNGGAPGIDEMTTGELKTHLQANWEEIKLELLSGQYNPKAVRRVEIPKAKGGKRQLGIPTVLDRMIQQALSQELDKLYDATFSSYSYGFRRGRSAHQAIDQALHYLNSGCWYVVEIDLEQFFDRVNHDKLMHQLSSRILDKRVLKLIRRYLQSGIMSNGVVIPNREGTPQGGNLSPILSNIVLDQLDKELESRGHHFVRYADDVSIYVQTQRAGERVLQSTIRWIEKELKLKVNRNKSGVRRVDQTHLLGFGFYHSAEGVRPRISRQAYERLKAKLKKLTSRSWSLSMEERLCRINQVTKGWINYFAVADARSVLSRLDTWLRARLRMCIWKQWKQIRTRWRNLVKLGIAKYQAYQWANTRKGYWRVAHSPILQRAISTNRLKQRKYVSLLELYDRRRLILTNRRDTRTVRPVV